MHTKTTTKLMAPAQPTGATTSLGRPLSARQWHIAEFRKRRAQQTQAKPTPPSRPSTADQRTRAAGHMFDGDLRAPLPARFAVPTPPPWAPASALTDEIPPGALAQQPSRKPPRGLDRIDGNGALSFANFVGVFGLPSDNPEPETHPKRAAAIKRREEREQAAEKTANAQAFEADEASGFIRTMASSRCAQLTRLAPAPAPARFLERFTRSYRFIPTTPRSPEAPLIDCVWWQDGVDAPGGGLVAADVCAVRARPSGGVSETRDRRKRPMAGTETPRRKPAPPAATPTTTWFPGMPLKRSRVFPQLAPTINGSDSGAFCGPAPKYTAYSHREAVDPERWLSSKDMVFVRTQKQNPYHNVPPREISDRLPAPKFLSFNTKFAIFIQSS